jgi:hypothetical protein
MLSLLARTKSIQLFLIKKYYKMFFLFTHMLIGKYYPSLITQFIIGCICYFLTFLIIRDIINNNCIEQYKYYALLLIAVDTSFIIYKAKCQIDSTKMVQPYETDKSNNNNDNTTTDLKTGNFRTGSFQTASFHSVSLSSEINDFKITHDLSLSESNNDNTMFSTSDEKSAEKSVDKNGSTAGPIQLLDTSSESINQKFDIFK